MSSRRSNLIILVLLLSVGLVLAFGLNWAFGQEGEGTPLSPEEEQWATQLFGEDHPVTKEECAALFDKEAAGEEGSVWLAEHTDELKGVYAKNSVEAKVLAKVEDNLAAVSEDPESAIAEAEKAAAEIKSIAPEIAEAVVADVAVAESLDAVGTVVVDGVEVGAGNFGGWVAQQQQEGGFDFAAMQAAMVEKLTNDGASAEAIAAMQKHFTGRANDYSKEYENNFSKYAQVGGFGGSTAGDGREYRPGTPDFGDINIPSVSHDGAPGEVPDYVFGGGDEGDFVGGLGDYSFDPEEVKQQMNLEMQKAVDEGEMTASQATEMNNLFEAMQDPNLTQSQRENIMSQMQAIHPYEGGDHQDMVPMPIGGGDYDPKYETMPYPPMPGGEGGDTQYNFDPSQYNADTHTYGDYTMSPQEESMMQSMGSWDPSHMDTSAWGGMDTASYNFDSGSYGSGDYGTMPAGGGGENYSMPSGDYSMPSGGDYSMPSGGDYHPPASLLYVFSEWLRGLGI